MGGYNKFNVTFTINGVEFVDCRAFLKVGFLDYRRIGADEHNNVEHLLSSDMVEGHCLANGIAYGSLLTEEEMNKDFMKEAFNEHG
jgi:hypothetical protein